MEAQSAVRRALAAALAPTEVRVTVPAERPGELVVVRREGGHMRDALVDEAGIGLDCYAPTEELAAELAGRARRAMLSLPFADGFARVEETACRSERDMRRDCPRWYASFTVYTY